MNHTILEHFASFKRTFYTALLFLLLAAQGCAPAVVATGAAAGYYVHQDERRLGQIIDDASITATIKSKLLKNQQVSAFNFNIDTLHGVVTIYGSVPSRTHEEQAIKIAQEVDGVKKIISKVTIVQNN